MIDLLRQGICVPKGPVLFVHTGGKSGPNWYDELKKLSAADIQRWTVSPVHGGAPVPRAAPSSFGRERLFRHEVSCPAPPEWGAEGPSPPSKALPQRGDHLM